MFKFLWVQQYSEKCALQALRHQSITGKLKTESLKYDLALPQYLSTGVCSVFNVIFVLVLGEFHRCIQCIFTVFSPNFYPWSTTPPYCGTLFLLSLFYNPMTPVCAAHVFRAVEPSTGAWLAYQGPNPSRKWILPPPEAIDSRQSLSWSRGLTRPPHSTLECMT